MFCALGAVVLFLNQELIFYCNADEVLDGYVRYERLKVTLNVVKFMNIAR